MEYNTTKYHYIPCPSWLIFIYETVALVTLFTSTIIYLIVAYIVIKKSPKEMGTYKWYIFWNSSVTYLFEFMYGLCHPEPLMPYPIMVYGGIGRLIDFGAFSPIYADIAILAVISCFYGTTMMFLYRYCQTRNIFLLEAFTRAKYAIPIHLGAHFAAIICIIIPFHLQYAPSSQLKEVLEVLEPPTYERIKNGTVIGLKFDGPQLYYVAVYSILAFSCLLSIIVIFSITHTYRVLRANKNIFSKRTYTLYRTLINALVLEMLLSGAMVMAPLVVTITCFLFDFEFTSIIAMLSLLSASLFPTVLHLLTLFYVAPYKRAIIRIYKRLRGMPVEAMTTYDLTKAPVTKQTQNYKHLGSTVTAITTFRSHSSHM